MKNVVGMFDNINDAQAVVRDLHAVGVDKADISFAGRDQDAATMESNEYIGDGHSEAAEGAGFGATGGTVVGGLTGLLVGLGALAIPGIGPVIAAGSIATALGSAALGAGIGAAAGGLLGALVGAGIPEEDANIYSEGIRRGGALVMARVDDNLVETTLDIMEHHNVVDIDERGTEYRSGGWSRYDESTGSYADTTSSTDTSSRTIGDTDLDSTENAYDRSSKVGTAGGTLAGAATGAAIGSVGGPIGTVIGGVAGAVTGGGVGAAGDAAGAQAADDDRLFVDTDNGSEISGNTQGSGADLSGQTGWASDRTNDTTGVGTSSTTATSAGYAENELSGNTRQSGADLSGQTGWAADRTSDTTTSYSTVDRSASTAYGRATDIGATPSRMSTPRRSRTYDAASSTTSDSTLDPTAQRIETATERGLDGDLDRGDRGGAR